ncbi:recombinase family protein [Sebaldella sp. S0638]|uniref:recombinase family protein n=1 Tax=Sebaldella sp. S0638 TaxID=2957809 RepID=UPI00209E54B7|nr:recombinase family protein [Sebaldella sp. S0638]MCP1225404.1 recombinase family protein [Sebaldella sp. S0638]
MQNCIIYARVSTTMQEDNESLKYQIIKTQEYAISKGYHIKRVISDVESGGKDDRPGFLELMKEIHKKSFDVLIVFEISRVSRTSKTLINFVFDLNEKGIKFIPISQPELDTTTPTGMLFFHIQSGLAGFERKQISIRTKSNKLARAKDGIWQGGTLPFGYTKDNNNNIIPDEENAYILKNIFLDYIEYRSLKKVAEKYHRNISSIKFMLSNKFYIGKLPYGKQENNIDTNTYKRHKEFKNIFEGRHPAIIDLDIFDTVQDLISQNNIIKTNGLLFSGILKCHCGGKMYKSTCSKGFNNYKCNICNKAISTIKIEKEILKRLMQMTELEKLNSMVTADNTINMQKKINISNKKISSFEDEKLKLIDLLTKNLLTENEFVKSKKRIDNKIDLENQNIKKFSSIIAFEDKKNNQMDNIEILRNVIKNIKDDEITELNEIFRMLINEIILISKAPLQFNIKLNI